MKKKLMCLVLALITLFSVMPGAAAAETDEATAAAEALYELGLFRGTGTNADGTPIFDLDKTPTRNQAVIMLVRLLGKEEEALAGNWKLPFTDVAKNSAAYPYIGYAYANGLTNGTTKTTYSGTNPIRANQYIAFVLRALGYASGRDFQVGTSWKLANDIGLTDGEYDNNPAEFTRGDVAILSYQSLSCPKYVDIFSNIPAETDVQKSNFAELTAAWDWRYNFPADSKGLTLSWEQARALVGQDMTTVKRYVKTIEDCLYYICAADYGQVDGDLRQRDNVNYGITWHFNRSPQVVFAANEGNCGGTSGLMAYLLEGDYDEVGYACYRSTNGGHVVNYIKDGELYYVFDLNQFTSKYSRALNLCYNKDLNAAVKEAFGIGKDREHPTMMAYTYTGRFDGDEPTGWPQGHTTYIIDGYSEKINIVHETPEEGYVYKIISVDQRTLDQIEEIRNQK